MNASARLPTGQQAVPRDRLVHLVQGEYKIVSEPNVVLTTILGSCVACCMRDPVAGVGGMNHFLLPGGDENETGADLVKYGVNSMELLINGLLREGAARSRLEAKLFGGARVVRGLSDVGARNSVFAREFLQLEGIACVGESLGGEQARRIRYWPQTGRAAQILIEAKDVFATERAKPAPAPVAKGGDLELF
jgi:chemotaxis protein CheD